MACCGDCRENKPCRGTGNLVVFQQASESGPQSIWGPISAEMPSRDEPIPKLVRLEAIERHLPELVKRGRFSVRHSDTLVGEVFPLLEVDPERVPPQARDMVKEVVQAHGGLPTGFVEVTPNITRVFPKLEAFMGKRLPFAAGTIYDDNKVGKMVQADIREGNLDSFSISGYSKDSRIIEYCDTAEGCRMVEEIPDFAGLDTVTLASSTGKSGRFGSARAQNPGAAFVVVQQAQVTKETGGNRYPQNSIPNHDEQQEVEPMSQATATKETEAPAPADAPKEVKQMDEEGSGSQVEEVLADLARRLQALEERLAAGETQEAEDKDKDKDDEKDDEDEKEVKQTETPVSEQPITRAEFKQACEELKQAFTKSTEAPTPETPKEAPKQEAAPKQVQQAETPDPAPPKDGDDPDPASERLKELHQAYVRGEIPMGTYIDALRDGGADA